MRARAMFGSWGMREAGTMCEGGGFFNKPDQRERERGERERERDGGECVAEMDSGGGEGKHYKW